MDREKRKGKKPADEEKQDMSNIKCGQDQEDQYYDPQLEGLLIGDGLLMINEDAYRAMKMKRDLFDHTEFMDGYTHSRGRLHRGEFL